MNDTDFESDGLFVNAEYDGTNNSCCARKRKARISLIVCCSVAAIVIYNEFFSDNTIAFCWNGNNHNHQDNAWKASSVPKTINQQNDTFHIQGDTSTWPLVQHQLCPNGVPLDLERIGPLLFALARQEIASTNDDYQTDPPRDKGGFISKFFNGTYGTAASLYTTNSTSTIYIRIWKAGNDQIRQWMKEAYVNDFYRDTVGLPHAMELSSGDPCVVTAIRDPVSHFLSGYNEIETRLGRRKYRLKKLLRHDMDFERLEGGSQERFEGFVKTVLQQDAVLQQKVFLHVFPQSRVLAVLRKFGWNLTGYLPSISNLATDWPLFLQDTCPAGTRVPVSARVEKSAQHESSLDKHGFYQAAKKTWAQEGATARALCVLHAMDYACWQDLPDGIPSVCQEVFSTERFVSTMLNKE